jgi:hypothetical protein
VISKQTDRDMTTDAQTEKQKIWDELEAGTPAAETAPAAEAAKPTEAAATETAATPATVAPEPAAEADPYAGVPQIVRDEIAGLKTMFQRQTSQLDAANGKIGGLNRTLLELKAAKDSVTATGGDAPTAAQLKAAQGDGAAMAKLKADYPEFGSALDAALNEKLGSVQEQLAKARPADQPAGITPEAFEAYKRDTFVESKHPDWKERVKTPAFHGWLGNQPREVQLLAGSADPRDAVRLLDLETEARKKPAAEVNTQDTARLDAAAGIPLGRGAQTARLKPIESMSKAEYWAYLDEQDRHTAKAA